MAETCGEDEGGKGGKVVISEHCRRKWECRKTKVNLLATNFFFLISAHL